MRIRCHAAALSGISRLGGLRSAPLPERAARRGEGRERTGVFTSLFSQEPWPSMKAAAVALRPIFFSGFGGEREGKGSVVLFKQQQKKTRISSLRQLKSSLINGPVVLARRSQVPFTWRLPGRSILFPILSVVSSPPRVSG